MWWGDVHCSFQRSWGTAQYPERQVCTLSFKCAFTLCFPCLWAWLPDFTSHSQTKRSQLTSKSQAASKGCPAHTATQQSVFRCGWPRLYQQSLEVLSQAERLERANFKQRPSKAKRWTQMIPCDCQDTQPQSSAFRVQQAGSRMQIQWGCLRHQLG